MSIPVYKVTDEQLSSLDGLGFVKRTTTLAIRLTPGAPVTLFQRWSHTAFHILFETVGV